MKSFVVKVDELFKLSEKSSVGEELFNRDINSLRIPLYQREYKWDSLRVTGLLEDVIAKEKLLGIVLLDENKLENVYEIVDGQQRVTTLLFILIELYNRLATDPLDQSTVYETIHPYEEFVLKNDSFGTDYIAEVGGKLKVEIKDDVYFQTPVVDSAFDTIRSILDSTDVDLSKIVSNILKCQFVVIVNKDSAGAFQDPVEQIFLDINEKSQGLDAEDIFKGHCFKNFGGLHIDVVKKDWENVKITGMQFCNQFMKNENISAFLYYYLLIREDINITDRLTYNGKHYMHGKNQTATHNILENIHESAKSIIEIHDRLADENYRFEDMCKDILVHKNESEIKTARIILKEILDLESADYPKFPTYYFLYKLWNEKELQNVFMTEDIREIISNLYIYTFIFAYTDGRKSKKLIDYSIRDAFNENDKTVVVSNVRNASRKLRKNAIQNFALNENIKKYDTLAFYYSILDFYRLDKLAFCDKYVSQKDTNLEHFVMPDSNGIVWYRNEKDKYKFKVDQDLFKNGKNSTINYLVINRVLNENMQSFDIIKKIQDIREWYSEVGIPRHVVIIIEKIEEMETFKCLKMLKDKNEKDDLLVEKAYIDFLMEYFSEENKYNLTNYIWQEITNCFVQ